MPRILRAEFVPPSKWDRTHSPRRAKDHQSHSVYLKCLRWEFGFQCAFCLVHEADLGPGCEEGTTAVGSGQFTVEHFKTRENHPGERLNYGNCYYACRYCNGTRGNRYPHTDLLDPCQVSWADHFQARNFRLAPVSGGAAVTTAKAYGINDPRRRKIRRIRERSIENRLEIIRTTPGLEAVAIQAIMTETNRLKQRDLVAGVRILRDRRESAERVLLERFRALPSDAPRICRIECPQRKSPPTPVQLLDSSQEWDP